ncbi:MAG TPA: hypothetical protein VMM55_10200 [Thermohalobaculum sp.]|nr:hypothetical protein [Thermohalobaculum sp.]
MKLRRGLVIVGWLLLVGSAIDALVLVYAGWIVLDGAGPAGMSVDVFLRDHLAWIYWIKQVAYVVLPDGFVTWVFRLPALAWFAFRLVVSTLLGAWALSAARRMPDLRLRP